MGGHAQEHGCKACRPVEGSAVPSLRGAVLIVVTWATATFFGLAFAELTKVGPVLVALTSGHGVHVGDLVAFAAAYSAAALLTRQVLRLA